MIHRFLINSIPGGSATLQKSGGQTMNKIKLVVAITVVGFLGLQYTFIEQTQDPAKDQMKNNQINNDTNKQKNHEANK